MNPIDIVIVLLAVGLVLFTVIFNIYRRIKGKAICNLGGNCNSCPSKCNNKK
ncbi:hypothetical protein [endosymbiont 'TC1' of Trimyema compressum]|uniref:hypothetical protein n=1 Tax=endosymbiont 'TC1' of Trimyema compressum TaxID=243899 RepID=UPI00139243A4|nr:hypothetical protein [endosymbiont 'TC1' of Trimyema compressum]